MSERAPTCHARICSSWWRSPRPPCDKNWPPPIRPPQAAIRDAIAEIGGSIRAASRRASTDYALARVEVETLHGARKLEEQAVCAFAEARKFEHTAVALSLLTGAPIDLVERAMLDDNPDMAMILAKVAGFSWRTAQAILLRAANRSLSAQDLDRALSGFSRLKPTTARSILAFY